MSGKYSIVFSTGLLRCMIAMSVADNDLDDTEVKEIGRVYKLLTERIISDDVISETANTMMAQGISIENEIRTISRHLEDGNKDTLILASLHILAADGDIAESELSVLERIRVGMGLSVEQVEDIKQDFLKDKDLTETSN